MKFRKRSTVLGSSPLARGTPAEFVAKQLLVGLIPARAGNTRSPPSALPERRAHPRSRGEHPMKFRKRSTVLGSSPLARGTHTEIYEFKDRYGLIPARAGNTRTMAAVFLVFGAHPRSRGEHTTIANPFEGQQGSSPLARGTLLCGGVAAGVAGLIPARAGNTPRG